MQMDVLTQVLNVLHLGAYGVNRLPLDESSTPVKLGRDEAAAYIALGGRYSVAIGGRTTSLLRYDALLIAGRDHRLTREENSVAGALVCCRYHLERSLPHPLAGSIPDAIPIQATLVTDETEVGRIGTAIDDELVNGRIGAELIATRLADVLFVEILRRSQLQGPLIPFLAALSDPATLLALEALHGDPGRSWQVDELAQIAGLSRTAFSERFHELVGEPPLRYLRAWRLLTARQALRSRADPISTVARKAGYGSNSGFRRAFRRFFGHTPRDARRGS
jgi:AraC-like DNA-binding protein